MPTHPLQHRPRGRRLVITLIVAAIVFAALAPLFPTDGEWVVDTGARRIMTEAIRHHHGFAGFSIERTNPLGLSHPDLFAGWPFQIFYHEGRAYTQYPPLFAWLVAVAMTALPESAALRVWPILGALGVIAGAWLLARRMGARLPEMGAVAAMTALPLMPYAFTNWDILPAIALSLGSLVLMLGAMDGAKKSASGKARRRTLQALGAGLCAGVAFAMREEYLLWIIALFAGCGSIVLAAKFAPAMLRMTGVSSASRRSETYGALAPIVIAGCVAAAGCVAVMAFNKAAIGSFFFSDKWMAGNLDPTMYRRSLESLPHVIYSYVLRPELSYRADSWSFVATGTLFFSVLVLGSAVWRSLKWRGLILLLVCIFVGFMRVVDVWDFSLTFTAMFRSTSLALLLPMIYLGVWGASGWASPRPEIRREGFATLLACGLFVGAMILLSPLISANGFHWGPRLLLPGLVPVAVLSWVVLERGLRAAARQREAGLLLAAVALGLLCLAETAWNLRTLRVKLNFTASAQRALDKLDPSRTVPVLQCMEWIPFDFAQTWLTRPVLYYTTANITNHLATHILHEHGYRRAFIMGLPGSIAMLCKSANETSSSASALTGLPQARMDLPVQEVPSREFYQMRLLELRWSDGATSAPAPLNPRVDYFVKADYLASQQQQRKNR